MKLKKYLTIFGVPLACMGSFVFISAYEVLKQQFFPDISPWYSHWMTIVLFTVIACITAFFIKKQVVRFNELKGVLNESNKALESRNMEKEIRRQERKNWEKTFDAIDDWISIIDLESNILRSNITVEKYFNLNVKKVIDLKCCKLVHGTDSPVSACPLPRMVETRKRESAEVQVQDGRWMRITVDPIFDTDCRLLGAVHTVRDVTKRVSQNREREKLLADLQDALSRIKTLNGLIPICSCCKKIRDDKGYWNQLETYIEDNSDACFSHGMCPECTEKMYGKEDWYVAMKQKKK